MPENKELQLLLDTCLTAGKIMTESGSEVYRVEDTMNRIAYNAGQTKSISYVTATGLFMSFSSSNYTQLENVTERKINLEKVASVNNLSRKFAEKEIDLEELHRRLKQLQSDAPSFPVPLQAFCAGVVSCTLMYIFGGTWYDFVATFFIGIAGFLVTIAVNRWLAMKYLDDFLSAFVIGLLAYLAVHFRLAQNMDNIIIGAVMPLVPGVAITNSFRDILAGHLLSGMARITEAIFIAGAIGIGIAVVFKIFL